MQTRKISVLFAIIILLSLTFTAAAQQGSDTSITDLVAAANAGVLNLTGGDVVNVICDGKRLRVSRDSSLGVLLSCDPRDEQPTATQVPTEPTATQVPAEPTATQQPTEPTATPTQPPTSSVPLCTNHDSEAWHGLYDAANNCHYDHEHKQDPNTVNDIFGPVGALYGGQEISYPWQTFSSAGTENELKHGGYGWLVTRDMDCFSAFSDGCLTDFRVEYHAIMAAHGAVTRNHSFWLEARGCREDAPDRCGIIRTGGWADYGKLEIDGQHVPLAGDPTGTVSGRRIHYYNQGSSNYGTWYGNNRIALVAIQTSRMWGLVDPSNPSELHLFCPDMRCKNNNSQVQAHAIGVTIPSQWDLDGDGLVSYKGYTDRQGNPDLNCTSVGPECVPLELIDMPVGTYQFRDDTHGLGDTGRGDFDVSPPGEFWIAYPN